MCQGGAIGAGILVAIVGPPEMMTSYHFPVGTERTIISTFFTRINSEFRVQSTSEKVQSVLCYKLDVSYNRRENKCQFVNKVILHYCARAVIVVILFQHVEHNGLLKLLTKAIRIDDIYYLN